MRRFVAVCLALALPVAARAHLLPKQTATMNIVGQSAFCVVSVPASTLVGVDDDGNGVLSPAEIQRHAASIQRQFEAGFRIRVAGNAAESVLSWASPAADDVGASDYVVILHRANFGAELNRAEVSTELFGTGTGEREMTIRATREVDGAKVSEVAILARDASSHTFFAGPWSIFEDYVRIGIGHILHGLDHLLFLLTIIVAAAGWRYWLAVVTTFTVALGLSAMGAVRVPTAIVEPGIAASIVLLGLLNLRKPRLARDAADAIAHDGTRSGGERVLSRGRLAVVFACGLLHGFGFSSAIGDLSVSTATQLATVAGFNTGIEIGQFLFLSGILMTVTLGRRVVPVMPRVSLPLLASLLAVLAGVAMLIARVSPRVA